MPINVLIVFVALAVVFSISYYFFSDSPVTRASKQTVVSHEIVNMFPQQIGVYWEVEEDDNGWLIFGQSPTKLDNVALDEMDIKTTSSKRKYHYALMKNLDPDTKYYYAFVSNNEKVSPEDGKAYSVTSLSSQIKGGDGSPAYGIVLQDNGSPAAFTYIMLRIDGAYPLIGISSRTGEWLIPLQYIVGRNSNQRMSFTTKTPVDLTLFSKNSRSQIRASIENIQPVKQSTILGKDYNFVDKENVLAAVTAVKSQSGENTNEINVLYPKQNSVIPVGKPLIKGNAMPGQSVIVTINTKPQAILRTTADESGAWTVRVGVPIVPGRYTLTMTTLNSLLKTVNISRNFIILKSGERVLGESTSTPSGTITAGPSISGTISPSLSATPSLPTATIVSLSPTEILAYDLTPTVTPVPPVSGISTIPYLLGGIALVLVGAGLVVLL